MTTMIKQILMRMNRRMIKISTIIIMRSNSVKMMKMMLEEICNQDLIKGHSQQVILEERLKRNQLTRSLNRLAKSLDGYQALHSQLILESLRFMRMELRIRIQRVEGLFMGSTWWLIILLLRRVLIIHPFSKFTTLLYWEERGNLRGNANCQGSLTTRYWSRVLKLLIVRWRM